MNRSAEPPRRRRLPLWAAIHRRRRRWVSIPLASGPTAGCCRRLKDINRSNKFSNKNIEGKLNWMDPNEFRWNNGRTSSWRKGRGAGQLSGRRAGSGRYSRALFQPPRSRNYVTRCCTGRPCSVFPTRPKLITILSPSVHRKRGEKVVQTKRKNVSAEGE